MAWYHAEARVGYHILVEINASVRKLAEGSSLLELGGFLSVLILQVS